MSGILQGFIASLGATVDDFFEYVTLLLPGNGTNGAQNNTFLDSSTNAFTITRNGNTTQGTFTPYGDNWSNYFDGSGDSLVAPDSSAFAFGTGDFTIEAWIYRTSSAATGTVLANIATSSDGDSALWLFVNTNNAVVTSGWFTNFSVSSSNVVTNNTWTHIAFSRSGTAASVWVNGTRVSNFTFSNNLSRTTGYRVGAYATSSDVFNGYISNARVVKGTAVYDPSSTTITVPIAPLTAITNTSLLTCQSNRFIDNSTNAFTITVNGNTSVQRFNPFNPTASYAVSTIGGSGYFDGTGDYLDTAASSALSLTGQFTVECWYFQTAVATYPTVFELNDYRDGILFRPAAGSQDGVWVNGSQIVTGVTESIGRWNYFAITRNASNSTSVYINGARVYNGTISGTINSVNGYLRIGTSIHTSGQHHTGYISDMRVVKGSAVYDPTQTTITLPTAPLTAITNTQLLCNFTNAGIIDNAMMNDLETVGNAQISTSVSKFGGGSMYFDGTGDGLVSNGVSSSGAYNRLTASGVVNTVEFWLYVNSFTSPRAFLCGSWASSVGWTYDVNTSGDIFISTDGSGPTVTLSSKITTGVWQHLAFVNDGTNIKIYLNGTNVGTQAVAAPTSYIGPLNIGLRSDATLPLNGYIDDLRITKGVARYTANFTAPTAPFPTR